MASCRCTYSQQTLMDRKASKIFRGGSERGVQEIFPALLGQAPSK